MATTQRLWNIHSSLPTTLLSGKQLRPITIQLPIVAGSNYPTDSIDANKSMNTSLKEYTLAPTATIGPPSINKGGLTGEQLYLGPGMWNQRLEDYCEARRAYRATHLYKERDKIPYNHTADDPDRSLPDINNKLYAHIKYLRD